MALVHQIWYLLIRGGKIRRQSWPDGVWLMQDGEVSLKRVDTGAEVLKVPSADLLADDWTGEDCVCPTCNRNY